MTSVRLPDFLIVGAHKAGTTALFNMLGQHPSIFVPVQKEPRFFALEGDSLDYRGPRDPAAIAPFTTPEKYSALFAAARKQQVAGEASTLYLYDPRAPLNIARHRPDMRIIAMLRDPADRAYSIFVYNRRDGREVLKNFDQALAAEDIRVAARWGPLWHYRRKGFYGEQLSRYYAHFAASQILVCFYDDFVADPSRTVQRIFRFLGVDPLVAVDVHQRRNVSGVPRSPALQRLIKSGAEWKRAIRVLVPQSVRRMASDAVARANLRATPRLDPAMRRQLLGAYKSDLRTLRTLLGSEVPSWARESQS